MEVRPRRQDTSPPPTHYVSCRVVEPIKPQPPKKKKLHRFRRWFRKFFLLERDANASEQNDRDADTTSLYSFVNDSAEMKKMRGINAQDSQIGTFVGSGRSSRAPGHASIKRAGDKDGDAHYHDNGLEPIISMSHGNASEPRYYQGAHHYPQGVDYYGAEQTSASLEFENVQLLPPFPDRPTYGPQVVSHSLRDETRQTRPVARPSAPSGVRILAAMSPSIPKSLV